MADMGPFTEADFDTMKANRAGLKVARQRAKMAQQAGFDVTDAMQRIDEADKRLAQVMQTYFPNRS